MQHGTEKSNLAPSSQNKQTKPNTKMTTSKKVKKQKQKQKQSFEKQTEKQESRKSKCNLCCVFHSQKLKTKGKLLTSERHSI